MVFPAACLPLALDHVSLRKPEERAPAGSGEKIPGLGTGTGSHPCSAAGLSCDYGQCRCSFLWASAVFEQ